MIMLQNLFQFVKDMKKLYGQESLIYNVHNLLHLTDDVQKFGVLGSFSAFSFANYLGKIKGFLRTPNKPLTSYVTVCQK